MQVNEFQEEERYLASDLKQFPQRLKQRNPVLFYLGSSLFAVFFLFLIGFALCHYSIYEICHWLKPGKFSFSFAAYAFTMGWFLYYLKDTVSKSTITALTWIITSIISLEMLTMLVQSWMSSSSYLSLGIPHAQSAFIYKKLSLLSDSLIIANTFLTIFVAVQFFRPIQLSPKTYLWAIRASFVIFNLSCILGLTMLLHYGPTSFDTDALNLPFTQLTTLRNNLLSLHFAGIHTMQIIPFAAYYFPNYLGKKFLLSITAVYSLASVLLLLQLALRN